MADQVVGGYQGDVVRLECEVEAWPAPVNYWEKDGRLLGAGDRHSVDQVEGSEPYQYIMVMNVTLVSQEDIGTYYCVCKNEMGITRGNIQVYSEYQYSTVSYMSTVSMFLRLRVHSAVSIFLSDTRFCFWPVATGKPIFLFLV